MKKTLLILPLFLIFALFASAQTASGETRFTVTGQVVDSLSGKGVEYATVALLPVGSGVAKAVAVADDAGRFSLEAKEPGTFNLTATSVGYASGVLSVTLAAGRTKVDVGTLRLVSGTQIQEVVVAAQRPLVSIDVDRLTYSVESDPDAPTSTLEDMLRRVPQLEVDAEGTVTLNGQSDFKVLVNGKSSPMFDRNLAEIIKSMPASSIKEIQVMTTPPSRYEAEGAGGIINIVTTRSRIGGYSGRVRAGVMSHESRNASVYLSSQVGKFNFSLNYWTGRYGNPGITGYNEREAWDEETRERREISFEHGRAYGRQIGHNANIEASYEIDTFNLITLSTSGYTGNWKGDTYGDNRTYGLNGALTRQYSLHNFTNNRWGGVSGSLDYQRTFRKPEKTFTVSYKIDLDPEHNRYLNRVDPVFGWGDYLYQRSDQRENGQEHTLQIDYYDPLTKKHHIEAGVKYLLRLNTNESTTEIAEDDPPEWTEYDRGEADLDYKQHIFGAYGGYLYKLEKFTAKAGFRAEGTINDGTSKTYKGDERFDNRLFNLIPYVNLSYMLNKSNTVRFSYTQRLRRPRIHQLNPYRDESNPLDVRFGNPSLDAVVTHSFALNYSTFGKSSNLIVGLTTAFTNNPIERITTAEEIPPVNPGDDPAYRYETTYFNTGREQRYGMNASYSYRIKTLFRVNAGFNAGYSILEASERGLRNEGWRYGGNLGLNVSLWKDAQFRANGGFGSRRINLQGRGSGYHYSSFGLAQQLFKKKVDVNLALMNPFTKYRTWSRETETSTGRTYSEQRMNYRRWAVSVGFRFGKTDAKVKKASRGIESDSGGSSENEGEGNGGGGGGISL